MIHPRLRSIPPANRRCGNLACVARFGKGQPRVVTQEASTSFRPRVIAPDLRIRAAREAFRATVLQRRADVEQLIAESAAPEEAGYWQEVLRRWEREY